MNAQVVKLFGLIVVLFALLIGFTSRWSVFQASDLMAKTENKRPLLEAQQIHRGRILTADGTVIARSVTKGHGSGLRYVRRYPHGYLFGHPIGYSFVTESDSEFEKSHNDELIGNGSEFSSIIDQLRGQPQVGSDIVTSIDADAQKLASSELQSTGFGAVVAIVPQTGAIKVMASNPSFDPNRVPEHLRELNASSKRPLVNRATQGQYPPGSTFKVVTAAAGLDSGTITPETTINAPGSLDVQGQPLQNDYTQDFGPISLDTALTNSVNTWFAQLGEQVGEDTLFTYMDRFGFNSTPQVDLPSDQVYASGIFDLSGGGSLLRKSDPIDIARVAIGQERLLATPLQMAEVAATVANGGKLMKPQILSRVVDPDGRVTKRVKPTQVSEVFSQETADQLTPAMQGVVSAGTGTNAAIPGVDVAGKTGTAETPGNASCGGGSDENQAWFIGFAPAEDPQIAIAASIECTTQFGNDVAAPIFSDVAQSLLDG